MNQVYSSRPQGESVSLFCGDPFCDRFQARNWERTTLILRGPLSPFRCPQWVRREHVELGLKIRFRSASDAFKLTAKSLAVLRWNLEGAFLLAAKGLANPRPHVCFTNEGIQNTKQTEKGKEPHVHCRALDFRACSMDLIAPSASRSGMAFEENASTGKANQVLALKGSGRRDGCVPIQVLVVLGTQQKEKTGTRKKTTMEYGHGSKARTQK